MIQGISHITLAVTELERSIHFYGEVLGFEPLMQSDSTAYFLAGDLWFCVVQDPEQTTEAQSDYSHIAFSISEEDYATMAGRIVDSGVVVFKENESEGESLYFLDPDGHKLEIHCGTWQTRLEEIRENPWGEVKLFR